MGLLEEAITDAKKLREVAEQNAKNAIIESLAPVIKEMIEKEVSNIETSMLLEEDEQLSASMGNPEDSVVVDMNPELGGMDSAPISVKGDTQLDVPMPDDEGKVTIDFDSLFDKSSESDMSAPVSDLGAAPPVGELPPAVEPPLDTTVPPTDPSAGTPQEMVPPAGPPAEEVPPMPPADGTAASFNVPTTEAEALTYENYKIKLENVKSKIESLQLTESAEIKKAVLEEKLLSLFEMLENLDVPQKIKQLNENKLEILYKKLRESKNKNNYIRTFKEQKEKIDMAKLKDFTGKLFKEEVDPKEVSAPTSDGLSNKTEKTADVASKHAMSATKPNVDASKKDAPDGETVENKMWSEEFDRLEKELSEAMGDDEDKKEEEVLESAPAVVKEEDEVYEVDEKELAEALRSIRKESLKRKMRALKEEYSAIDECGDQMLAQEVEQMPIEADSMASEEMGGGIDLRIDLGDMEGDEMSGDMGMDSMGADSVMGDASALGADGAMEDGLGDEFDMDSLSLDDEEELEMPVQQIQPPMRMNESKKSVPVVGKKAQVKPVAPVSKQVAAQKELEKRLVESQLFNAKLVYLNKFLQRDNLSKKQKQKIVEYLDSAKTIEETKTVYGRIKKVLEESSRKSIGSSSRATKSASAIVDPNDSVMISESRWAELAGIKKSE